MKRIDHLEELLKDEKLFEMFTKRCEKEYSIENIAAYVDITTFKKTLEDPLRIYFRYFNGSNSVMEVNVPRKQRVEVFDKLKSGAPFDAHLFDDLERVIRENLSDTMGRFQTSNAYIAHLQKIGIQIELLDGK